MEQLTDIFNKLYQMTAFSNIIADPSFLIMYALAFVLLYLGIVKSTNRCCSCLSRSGVLLANFPGGEMGVIQADSQGWSRWPTAAKPTSGKCRCTTSPMNSA